MTSGCLSFGDVNILLLARHQCAILWVVIISDRNSLEFT